MKNLNVTITDDADGKLSEILADKHFKNRADTVEWLIQSTHKQLKEANCVE